MTYIPTWTRFLYLAVVIDAFRRKVVGWSMGELMTADLVWRRCTWRCTRAGPTW